MSETVRLVAVGPGTQFYTTRVLVAGDRFEMPREWANILVLLGKARLADDKVAPPEPKVAPPSADQVEDLNELRTEASRLGIIWDGRWGAVRLKHEIGLIRTK